MTAESVSAGRMGGELLATPELPDSLGAGFAWALVEHAPDGILVADDDGRILTANRRVEELFGHDRDALVGTPMERLIPPRFRHTHGAHRAMITASPSTPPMGLELVGCRADGSEFPVEIHLMSVAIPDGVVTVAHIRDESDRNARQKAAEVALVFDEDERIAAYMCERMVQRLFASGLRLSSALSCGNLDERTTTQLHAVIEELDDAIRDIRTTVFTRTKGV